ncbi:MAG: peptide chain release factor 1 [Microscillaceae bacterium]
MIDKLDAIRKRFLEVGQLIIEPDVIADMGRYSKLTKEYKELEKIDHKYKEYENVLSNLQTSKDLLQQEKDPEMREMAKMEIESLLPEKEKVEEELKMLLIPKDPNDSKNIVIEIRAGAGGDEAAIFAGDLFRMYQRFAEKQNWQMELIDFTDGTSGGYKEIVAGVSGADVYGMLKYESGVHRVQRVPATETQGRVHTSAASVVVLPEMDDVEVVINENDLRIDTFCSSGPGGQSVNTTYSAVRITHKPTGLVVSCQDEKSQIKNKEKALKVLRSRLYEMELKKQQDELGSQRKSMVGSGDRSDKIRTYNYPQSRVTDHRINYTVHNLPTVMDGEIGDFIENLRLAENAARLQEGSGS